VTSVRDGASWTIAFLARGIARAVVVLSWLCLLAIVFVSILELVGASGNLYAPFGAEPGPDPYGTWLWQSLVLTILIFVVGTAVVRVMRAAGFALLSEAGREKLRADAARD
jgi:ABC-type thiamin/hydroxymethylpyrimidine transport system permease subunit